MDIASDSPDVFNETAFYEDPYSEMDYEMELEFRRYRIIQIIQMVLVVVKLLVCLIAVAAAIFLVVTMFRFKRLQTRLNMYILHMSILCILLYLVVPTLILLFSFVLDTAHVYLLEIQNTILMLYIGFSLLLSIDWTISCLKPRWFEICQKLYQYYFIGIYSIYILFTVCIVVTMNTALVLLDVFVIYYILCCLVLIALNIFRRVAKLKPDNLKTAYVMTVSNISIFSFIPTIAFYWSMMYLLRHNFFSDLLMLFVEALMLLITIGHPIFVVFYLGRSNKYFKMAYNKSFKRSIRTYADDNLDDVSDEESPDVNKVVNYSNENGLDENKQVLIA